MNEVPKVETYIETTTGIDDATCARVRTNFETWRTSNGMAQDDCGHMINYHRTVGMWVHVFTCIRSK